MNCHGTFKFECDSNICAKNKISCNQYKKAFAQFLKILDILKQTVFPKLNTTYWIERNKKALKKQIKECKKKVYDVFKSTDFCLNGNNCIQIQE